MDYFGPTHPLRRIDRQRAEQFVASRVRVSKSRRGQDISGWTRSQRLHHCRAMWRKAAAWGFTAANVFDHIRPGPHPTRPWHYLTPAEFQTLLGVAPDDRWRAIYWLLYGCGLRFGEAFNLLWSDVDFEHGRIYIRNRTANRGLPPFVVKADGHGQSCRERSVPVLKPVADALAQWQIQAPEGVFFVLLTEARFEALQRNWARCRDGLTREGAKKPRP